MIQGAARGTRWRAQIAQEPARSGTTSPRAGGAGARRVSCTARRVRIDLRGWVLALGLVALAGCGVGDDDDLEASAEDTAALTATHEKFEVMSFNLRYEQAADTGARRWNRRKASVLARIEKQAPDVLGVQEAKRPAGEIDYPKELKAALTGSGNAYDVYDPGGGSPKLIFWKRARFERTGGGQEALPNAGESATCKDTADGKFAVWAKLKDRSTGNAYFIVNTHLVAGSCPVTREASAVAIKKMINARSGGLPVVLMGDMNVDPQAAGAKAEDTIHILEKRGRDLALAGDYAGTTTNARATFNSDWDFSDRDTKRIDYILVGGNGLTARSYTIDRTKNADGISPSDHYPILTTVGPP